MIEPFKSTERMYDMSDDQLVEIAKTIQTKGAVVFYEQNLTEGETVELCKRFGELEAPGLFMNPKEHPEIFYVTGQRDKDGNKIGMFGDTELGWHSNGNSRHLIDKFLITLYCEVSDINTTLSVCHTAMPFAELSEEEKDYWRSIRIKLKFKNNTIYQLEEDDPELEFMSANRGSVRNLVGKHPYTGEEYFYFPFHFICGAWEGKKRIDHEEMVERLKPIIFQSRYQYHHVFKEGDLLMMDQFTTLHRRTPVTDNNRLLYRMAGDYTNILGPLPENEDGLKYE